MAKQRRDGARRGALSQDVRTALRAEAQRLGRVDDPLEAARAVGDFFAAVDLELERVAQVRLRAVKLLREQGWSYTRIGEALGVSKQRAYQLANDKRG